MSAIVMLPSDLLAEVDIDPRWANGPFMGLKLMPAKAKGKRFEQIAEHVFQSLGFNVENPVNSNHDRIVNGHKYEIKGSTITKNTDHVFSFLQIRPAQDYDYLILQTFHFNGRNEYYRIPKADIQTLIDTKVLKKQHGGNKADSGTFCYNGPVNVFHQYFWFDVMITK